MVMPSTLPCPLHPRPGFYLRCTFSPPSLPLFLFVRLCLSLYLSHFPLWHPDTFTQTRSGVEGCLAGRCFAAQERADEGAALGGPSSCRAGCGALTFAKTCRGHLDPLLARLSASCLLTLPHSLSVLSCLALLRVWVLDDVGLGVHQAQLQPPTALLLSRRLPTANMRRSFHPHALFITVCVLDRGRVRAAAVDVYVRSTLIAPSP